MTKPLFESHSDTTLNTVRATYAQRGQEYADTWRTCCFAMMRAVAKELGCEIKDEHFRAIATAAFVDMKRERINGGWKEDSLIDGIAYESFLVEEMRQLLP